MAMVPLDRLRDDLLHALRASHLHMYGEALDLDIHHDRTSDSRDVYIFRFSSQDLSNIQNALNNILYPLTPYGLEYEHNLRDPEAVDILSIFDETPRTRNHYYAYSLYAGDSEETHLLSSSTQKTVLALSPRVFFSKPGSKHVYRQSRLRYNPKGEFQALKLHHKDEIHWTHRLFDEYHANRNELYVRAVGSGVQEYIGSMLAELDRIPGLLKYYYLDGREDLYLFFFHPGEVKLSEKDSLLLLTGMVMRFPLSV